MQGLPGFNKLLEAGAVELRNKGVYSVELTPPELRQMMLQVVAQSEGGMKNQGVTARVDNLTVVIAKGQSRLPESKCPNFR